MTNYKAKILCVLLLIFTSLSCSEGGGVKIKFERKEIDLGVLKPHSKNDFYIVFRNDGAKSLIISNIKGSCKCLSQDFDTYQLEPNQTDSVKMTYNASEIGHFEETVVFNTNTEERFSIITINATVQ